MSSDLDEQFASLRKNWTAWLFVARRNDYRILAAMSKRIAAAQGPSPARCRLLTAREVLELPDPEWLIDGFMEQAVFGGLYGRSGDGKTFVALDLALSIATGRVWQGRVVKQGPVVYVVAEGDTLSSIARKFYGNASARRRILEANRALIRDPYVMEPGWRLRIPQ